VKKFEMKEQRQRRIKESKKAKYDEISLERIKESKESVTYALGRSNMRRN
jgi:hypothetical protein